MPELPVLGLRVGKEVSLVHQKIDRRELLTNSDSFVYKERGVEDIWGMIESHLQLDILELISRFSFDKKGLRWKQLYHRNALSALFIGANSQKPFDLDGSQAILEVISDVSESIIIPQELALSGAVPDSKGSLRILALGYNLEDKFVQRADVTITDTEVPKLQGYYQEDLDKYRRCFKKLPIIPVPSLYIPTRSLVTPGMIDQTLGHQFLIESGRLTFGKMYFNHRLMERAGFYNTSSDDERNFQIGFKDQWNIKYPTIIS